MSVYITPQESHQKGIVVSTLAGLLASTIVSGASILIFRDPTIAKIIYIPLGLFAAYGYYKAGLFTTEFQKLSVQQRFGEATGRIYINGRQWRMRLIEEALQTPGTEERFILDMPKNEPEGKDTVKVYIGNKQPAKIRVMVYDPIRYSAEDDPEHTVEGSYGNQVRQFVNQMEYGLGLLEDKSLLEDYLELPPHPDNEIYAKVGFRQSQEEQEAIALRHRDMRARLTVLKHRRRDEESGIITEHKVIEPAGVTAIMNRAGRFVEELWEAGIHPVNMYAPSIDPSPAIDVAADEKEAQRHKNEVLGMQIRAQKRLAKEIQDDLHVPGEDALDRVGLNLRQDIKRNIIGFPGAREIVLDGIRLFYDLMRNGPPGPPPSQPRP